MRSPISGVLMRVIIVIAVLALVGLVAKLCLQILSGVLPPSFMAALSAGWGHLYSMVGPALPAVGALALLALLVWIISNTMRR